MTKNIQAQNYFEQVDNIQNANFYYQGKEETEYLYLLVLTSTQVDVQSLSDIPLERYGQKLEDWEVFQQEQIYQILDEFNRHSTISLSVYFIDKNIIQAENLDDIVEPLTKNFVLIADAFSLYFSENQNFAQLFDSKDKNKIGGCLIPICETFSENHGTFAKDRVKKTFKRLEKAWRTEFYKSYTHVELDIPNKTHFFRRLANIAYLKGITEKETMKRFEEKSKQLKQPNLDSINQ